MAGKPRNAVVPLIDDEGETLTPEEEAALAAEATSDATVIPPEQAESRAKPTPTEEPDAEAVAAAETAEPEKQQSSAQKRIQGLIARNKELEQQLGTVNEQRVRLEERRKMMQEREAAEAAEVQRKQQEARAAERPDPMIDPVGAQLWDVSQQNRELMARVSQMTEQFQQFGQQVNQQNGQLAVEQYLNTDYQRVRSVYPDIDNAIAYLRDARIEMNQNLGYSPEHAAALWEIERQAYVNQARQNGVSVNDFAYKMAQRVGYQIAVPNGNGNGVTAPRAVTAQTIPNGRERVGQLQRAQQMQGLGGKITSAEGDAHAHIKTMTAAQFDQFLESFGEGDAWMETATTDPATWKAIQAKFADLG